MYKIYCCVISILFFGVCFSGIYQNAEATTDAVNYISDRVQVVRPEKMIGTSVSDTIVSETGTTIAAMKDMQKPKADIPGDRTEGFTPGADIETVEKSDLKIKEDISALIGKKERFYSRKGRINPFEPFLRQPEPDVTSGEKSKLKQRVPRTPLEKIDLSQLKLTAVLRMPAKIRALVQESSGKGYVINEGTYIGNKGGQVSKIHKDRIMVEEKYLDVFGKISVREREMKLQQ